MAHFAELDNNNVHDHIFKVCVPKTRVPTRGAIYQYNKNNNNN